MYYEWDKLTETLTVFGKKTAVFEKDCDIVVIDGENIKMARPLTFVDGIPHVQADILCDVLGMTIDFGELFVTLTSK